MRVRRLDNNHDWTFGQSGNNYANESEAIAQSVQTRLWSFENDWFLDLDHGLPWLEQMGKGVNLSLWERRIKETVLKTEGVAQITDYQAQYDPDQRSLQIQIDYLDIYQQPQQASYRASRN